MQTIDPSRTRNLPAREIHPVARTPDEWLEVLPGERAFRALQVFRWIHQRGVLNPEQMTDLAKPLRAELASSGLCEPFRVGEVARSADGTRKLLLHLSDGNPVECVLIPMTNTDDADAASNDQVDDDDEDDEALARTPPAQRVTLCISTQVGCAMGCVFCASGRAGLKRGLGAGEIVAQVLFAKRYLEPGERLRNLVFMGMGEPLHHYDETARAIRLINHPEGLAMSPRKITVSTVGLVPGIRRLGEDFGGRLGLAVSLHAPDNETRDQILPMNRRFKIEELLAELHRYPLAKRRRITIEYTLIRGINDSLGHAQRLVKLLRGLRCKVNLIPMNPVLGSPLGAPSANAVRTFQSTLTAGGLGCSVRKRKGDDVDAACGQLAFKEQLVQLERRDGKSPDNQEVE
jgi:23S rRNA (adenine2503-C2)-methyltransferase